MNTRYFFLLILFLLVVLSIRSNAQGNGSDGALSVASGTTTINNTAAGVFNSNAAGSTINVASTTGFSVGKTVLIMQMLGTNAGSYNELTISSISPGSPGSLTFSSPTTVTYSSLAANRAQVIMIPQYTTVTVSSGATLTAPGWNGTTGGVLVYYANGIVTIDGTETMSNKGFPGGTGGTGSAAGTAGTTGSGGASSGANGTAGSGTGGANGGVSAGGDGGNGGAGNTVPINPGSTGSGVGGGTSGTAGANLSSGQTTVLMGGGGGGGQGGQGGQYGGAGGGGGASSVVALGSGKGNNGTAGTTGTASTAVGGIGGTGGGIILKRVYSMGGLGSIVSNGSDGINGTGIGGTGGDGGNGGDGGAFLLLGTATDGGGGGGGGKGGSGGQGSGGGGGGGAGMIVITTISDVAAWSGSMTNTPGNGGTGGAGGASGISGTAGDGGLAFLLGTPGVDGVDGPVVPAGATGPTGAPNPGIPNIFLPVTLTSFKGTRSNNVIVLEWSTSMETNNLKFIIEKSTDGIHFSELATVNGSNTKTSITVYTLNDTEPSIGKNYYKLKQEDINGRIISLQTIVVNFVNEGSLTVYPNPIGSEGIVNINYSSANNDGATLNVSLFNQLGGTLLSKELSIMNQTSTLELPKDIASGVYYLNVNTGSERYIEKIIIK